MFGRDLRDFVTDHGSELMLVLRRFEYAFHDADLAARKLPQTLKRPVIDALRDQYPTGGVAEYAGYDLESIQVNLP